MDNYDWYQDLSHTAAEVAEARATWQGCRVELAEAIDDARHAGVPWETITRAVGLSRAQANRLRAGIRS